MSKFLSRAKTRLTFLRLAREYGWSSEERSWTDTLKLVDELKPWIEEKDSGEGRK